MARSYEEATAERRARLSDIAQRQGQVFARAYDMGLQLAELRNRRGMTQPELAQATGIDQADISRIERGSANPTEKTLIRIAEALDAEWHIKEASTP